MKTYFGSTPSGEETYLYTLENAKLKAAVTDYGATLVSLIDRETGIDMVLGFDSTEEYCAQDAYIGASIGRTANRIGRGMFTLNGITYRVPVNNNGNCNHGGIEGFDKKVFAAEEKDNAVIFRRRSPHDEEGFPGNLDVEITYTLDEEGLSITASGISDQDTLFAYTCHSYFNMDESDTVLDEKLMLKADRFSPNDPDGMATGSYQSVIGTPFDFRDFHEIGERIQEDDIQLKEALGYDHFFPVEGEGIREMAVLKGKKLALHVYSDLPGIQVYTANYTRGLKGKYGRRYEPHCAAALEASYCPNAVNIENEKRKPILRRGETLSCVIRYVPERL